MNPRAFFQKNKTLGVWFLYTLAMRSSLEASLTIDGEQQHSGQFGGEFNSLPNRAPRQLLI